MASAENVPDMGKRTDGAPGDLADEAALQETGPRRRPTLAVVAAEAGVSLPTVSKVVNGRPDVAPGTRARVERLLGELNYPTGRAASRPPITWSATVIAALAPLPGR